MNYSEDSRIDEFCRELALALGRITGLMPDSMPGELIKQVEALSSPGKDNDRQEEEDDDEGGE